MKPNQRIVYLAVAAAFVLVWYFVVPPVIDSWKEQSNRIAELKAKVSNGQKLIDREDNLRQHWADMMHANLPSEVSAAETAAIRAVGRWAGDAKIQFTSLTTGWRDNDGYKTYDCRMAANGDQASLGRFIYELETDSIPVSLEECEITTRDAHGEQLTLTAHFSFLQLPNQGGNGK